MIDNAYYVDNKVALRYYQPVPKYIKIGNIEVVFQCEHGVSLSMVDEDKVASLLSVEGGCCGKKQKVITLANEATYQHWLNGMGGR